MMKSVLLCLSLLLAAPVTAQSVDASDIAEIEALTAQFITDMESDDIAGVIDAIPPRILDHIAQSNGMEPALLRDALIQQMNQVMQTATIDAFSMDVDQLVTGVTPIGRAYALVPTTTVLTIAGANTMEAVSQTLFLDDEGEWFMVRVDDPSQEQILRAVYPDFATINLPRGTMRALE